MDKNSTFGQLFEQGQAAADDSASDVVNTTKNQLFGTPQKSSSHAAQNTPSDIVSQIPSPEVKAVTTEDTKEMIRDFYGPSEDMTQIPTALPNDQENLTLVRRELQELHNDVYFDPLFAYEEKGQQEERKAEKIEREEKEELQALQVEDQKNPDPIALQRARTTTEMNRGVAG